MEHTDSGSLQNYLRENFIKLTWEDKYRLAYQPVCGVSYLHNKEFEHLNLCSGNILIHRNNIKLTDFRLFKGSEQEETD
ncbi:hypothetical protein RclHR1_09520004 [Rhizophagus clarus]|uniref:Protein kinase domain-containing protein n=1 Tax=Rhizophagus clarus TaxID=94130 RepID=A0A2Z6SQW6_9GLOM|nr:hypothetical protein RclHR1_09520004 [Rhizophagus clarus]